VTRVRTMITGLAGSKIVKFFFVALAGVTLDVLLFTGLVALGARPAVASIISSAVAVSAAYVVSSRNVFKVPMTPLRLVAYVAWYAASITGFSLAIDAAAMHFGGHPTFWKLISLPISFLINFAAVNYVILRPSPVEPAP